MSAPALTILVSPASVKAGAAFHVAYTATDPDEGRTSSGSSVDPGGQPYDWENTYHDQLTLEAPSAAGVTFTATGPGGWSALAPGAGTVTITGAVTDTTGTRTEATGRLTVTAVDPPAPSGDVLIGMSAKESNWDQRVREVGPGLEARRLFYTSWGASLSKVSEAKAAGMVPVLSWKLPSGVSWRDAANGQCDADLTKLGKALSGYGVDVWVALHHEPSSGAANHLGGENGSAADYAAMNAHCLPVLKAAGGARLHPCCIGNGWWWSSKGGLSDGELATWFPPAVLKVAEAVGGDYYQGAATAEGSGAKMRNAVRWAKRAGGVQGLCTGEFNCQTAAAITDAVAALREDPLWRFGCLWNETGTGSANAKPLTGSLLEAFRRALAG